MSEHPVVQEKSSVFKSGPGRSVLGWISASLAFLLIVGGIALHRACQIQITPSALPTLVVLSAILMAFQTKWRPRVESLLRDTPRAWIWTGIILFLVFPLEMFFYRNASYHLNTGLWVNLLLIAISAETVYQGKSVISSTIALIVGLVVSIAFFYIVMDVISGVILMVLLGTAIFTTREGKRLFPLRYGVIPVGSLVALFLFGLRPYQYRRLLDLFSAQNDSYGVFWRLNFQRAFKLGGPWGTDLSGYPADLAVQAKNMGDIDIFALPLLGFWKGWIVVAIAVLVILVLICLLAIQFRRRQPGPLKTFSLWAVWLFFTSLMLASIATTGIFPFYLLYHYGIPFLGLNGMTVLGVILVGLSWYEGITGDDRSGDRPLSKIAELGEAGGMKTTP